MQIIASGHAAACDNDIIFSFKFTLNDLKVFVSDITTSALVSCPRPSCTLPLLVDISCIYTPCCSELFRASFLEHHRLYRSRV